MDDMKDLVVFLLVVLFFFLVPVFGLIYISSCKQAEIFNRKNGTEYPCSDFFWAGEQINSGSYEINLNQK